MTVYRELSLVADSLQRAGTLPPDLRGKVDDIRLIVYTGHELGLGPAAAIRSIHVIKGKPVLSADLMVAVVLRSGLAEYFQCVASDDRAATYRTHRKGNPQPDEVTFSIDDARRAQLVAKGGNWEKYPRRMLQHRAASTLARMVYPDVLAGCYTPDESAEFSAGAVIDAEVVEPAPAPSATPDEAAPKSLGIELQRRLEACTGPDHIEAFDAICKDILTAHTSGAIDDHVRTFLRGCAKDAKRRMDAAADSEVQQ